MSVDYLNDLNLEQRKAVKHGIKDGDANSAGPLLVIAGAGTGKTKTLTHRVAHLIVNRIDPQRILLLTFSRRAAAEMSRRSQQIVAAAVNRQIDLPWSGTFHAIGARLLREYAGRIGLKPSFTIHDRSDSADLIDIVRHDLRLSTKESRFPKKDSCLAIYSLSVNSRSSLSRILKRQFPWCVDWKPELRALFAEYAKAKRQQNVLDYDDLLLYWAEAMKVDNLAAEIGNRFDHVLVDEYQDTNRLQSEILLRLKPDGRGVMVVGDDAQAIYSFRAATVRNILNFPGKFDPSARVITLEENYRSTQPILDACNAVMRLAQQRFTKNLRSDRISKQRPTLTTVLDEAAQARYVAPDSASPRSRRAVEISSRPVPSVPSQRPARDRTRQTQYCVRQVRGPQVSRGRPRKRRAQSTALGRKSRGSRRRFSRASAATGNWADNRSQTLRSDWQSPCYPRAADQDRGSKTSRRRLAHVRQSADPTAQREKGWPAEFQLIRQWYEPQLQQLYDHPNLRADDLGQLEEIAAGFTSRQQFLTELTLDPPNATTGPGKPDSRDEDYVVLLTIHSAKGQEWKSVTILSVVEGCIPSPKATETAEQIEEERRLLHVAMTRAKSELDLVLPQRCYTRWHGNDDQHVYGSISRFLPRSVRAAFESRTWHDRLQPSEAAPKKGPMVDVPATVSRMWR
jgi:DNA helicase II / ATP-dependent DNA helicase PcrA